MRATPLKNNGTQGNDDQLGGLEKGTNLANVNFRCNMCLCYQDLRQLDSRLSTGPDRFPKHPITCPEVRQCSCCGPRGMVPYLLGKCLSAVLTLVPTVQECGFKRNFQQDTASRYGKYFEALVLPATGKKEWAPLERGLGILPAVAFRRHHDVALPNSREPVKAFQELLLALKAVKLAERPSTFVHDNQGRGRLTQPVELSPSVEDASTTGILGPNWSPDQTANGKMSRVACRFVFSFYPFGFANA